MSDITLNDKIRCLKREIAMRERAYPKWLKAGKITLEASVHEIAAMKAVLHDYEVRAESPDQLHPRVRTAIFEKHMELLAGFNGVNKDLLVPWEQQSDASQMVYNNLARAAIWEIGGTGNANGAKPGGADRQP